MSRRSWWGWGHEDVSANECVVRWLSGVLRAALGPFGFDRIAPPCLEDLRLRPSRVTLPARLRPFCTAATHDRASHSYGKSYRDLVRAMAGTFDNPTDCVAYPRDEDDMRELMSFCEASGLALIPYGGGSSVTGGVEPPRSSRYAGAVTVDLRHLDRILDVDDVSHCARIQAGILGPALEAGLRPHGLTLRHFPQSFEFSSLGGWIATRSGGHFATGPTRIDDFVQSVRMVTPRGLVETRRLPSSGAGPSAERLIAGSEGILGIITEAWMRVQATTAFRAAAAVRFAEPARGLDALRAVSQCGLLPANCRLISPVEALMARAGDGRSAVLMLGFESSDHAVEAWMARALDLCAHHGGIGEATHTGSDATADPVDEWRRTFLQAPYVRDALVALGLLVETFETAVTWDRFDRLHARVLSAAQEAAERACGRALVTWRIAYVYPDGAAPYYTVIAPTRRGREIEQWAAIKAAISDAMLDEGGTSTHHHSVGRDHRPWCEQERDPLVAGALAAVKRTLDPHWILNPGVLIAIDGEREPGGAMAAAGRGVHRQRRHVS